MVRHGMATTRLRHFPNTAFGITLGLGGQAVLWKNVQAWPAAGITVLPEVLNQFFWFCCVISASCLALLFALKVRSHRDIVAKEWAHPIRFIFYLGPPCIGACFMGLGLPVAFQAASGSAVSNQVGWLVVFAMQTVAGCVAYRRWLYQGSFSETAAAPYLLCIVSWFLLAVWGQAPNCRINELGLPLVSMCFGVGSFWLAVVYPFILTGIFPGRTKTGHPALFLMLAPPSVAGIALGGPALMGSYGPLCESIFGAMLLLLVLLLVSHPQLQQAPEVLGVYWAYVFPPCALAVLATKIATTRRTKAMDVLAWILVVSAACLQIAVFVRTSLHHLSVMRGNAMWNDPLVLLADKANASACCVQESSSQEATQQVESSSDVEMEHKSL